MRLFKVKIIYLSLIILLGGDKVGGAPASVSQIAYTIRAKEGAILILGSREAIWEVKNILSRRDEDNVYKVNKIISAAQISGIYSYEIFLEKDIKYQKSPKGYQIFQISIREAEEEGLIPKISNLKVFLAKRFLETLGWEVIIESYPIGETEVFSPVDIIVRSAGMEVGNLAEIYVNGINVSPNKRGYNLVVIDVLSGEVVKTGNFDTRLEPGGEKEAHKLAEFIKGIPKGMIVVGAVRDEGSKYLTEEAVAALRSIGSVKYLRRRGMRRYSHALIGVKGAKPGEALEDNGFRLIELVVLKKTEEKNVVERMKKGEKIIILPGEIYPDKKIKLTIDE